MARDCFQAIGDGQVEDYPSNEVGTSDLESKVVTTPWATDSTSRAPTTPARRTWSFVDFVVVRDGRAVVLLGAQAGRSRRRSRTS